MLVQSSVDTCVQTTIKNATGIDPGGRITKRQATDFIAKADEHSAVANCYKALAGLYLARARDRAVNAGKTVKEWVATKPLDGLGRSSTYDHMQVADALFGPDATLGAEVLRLPWREVVRRARRCRANDGGNPKGERTPAQQAASVRKSADSVLRKADGLPDSVRTTVLEEIAEKVRSLLGDAPVNDDDGDDDDGGPPPRPVALGPVEADPTAETRGTITIEGEAANDNEPDDGGTVGTTALVPSGSVSPGGSLVTTWADIQRAFPRSLAPYPYTGGKRKAASKVWQGLGDVDSYVEPFLGSASVLLARPSNHRRKRELVGDIDAMIANFFRAVKYHPEEVAWHADYIVSAWDLTARHRWLIDRLDVVKANVLSDPDWCDSKVAAWWAWGIACWIGNDWCDPKYAPKVRVPEAHADKGIHRKTHLGKRSSLNNGNGVLRKTHHRSQGVHRNTHRAGLPLSVYFAAMADRLRGVKVLGDRWTQCVTRAAMGYDESETVGVFLDPPYAHEVVNPATGEVIWKRTKCYAHDDATVSAEVREWAIEHGEDPKMRIVLAGYEGEHDMPEGWRVVAWTAHDGMRRRLQPDGKKNADRERLWLSPHCLHVEGEQPVVASGRKVA